MDENDRAEYWATLALRYCKGLGARSLAKLLKRYGSALEAVKDCASWPKLGLRKESVSAFISDSWRKDAGMEWNSARKSEAKILLWRDRLYPAMLRQLVDAPGLLYWKGDITLLKSPCIAIVGSRNASRHGMAMSSHLAADLASCGMAVVSGMALGIDSAGHSAALKEVGRSIGVLGAGIDVVYPRCNGQLYKDMAEKGLLVSEFSPALQPVPVNFPIRNRIISGLCLGVVVVEAAAHSGSLITAQKALEQDREVFVMGCDPTSPNSLGCQNLIRDGARTIFNARHILRDLEDRLAFFNIETGQLAPQEAGVKKAGRQRKAEFARITPVSDQPRDEESEKLAESLASADLAARTLAFLNEKGALAIDRLAELLGSPIAELNSALIGMEMAGQIRRLPGSRIEAAQ